jgi:hypothetical protein
VLDPVPAQALVSAAVETTLVIAVSHRARALVRAATLLAAMDSAETLHDRPAAEEVIVWAGVASAVEDAAVEAAEEAGAEAEDKQTGRIPGERSADTTANRNERNRPLLLILAVGTALPSLSQGTPSSPPLPGIPILKSFPN